jgi:uncharacterized protein (DUF1330 family)
MEQQMPQSGFFIAQGAVKDFQDFFARYGSKVQSVAEEFGGEFLGASRAARAAEGQWDGNWTVITRFPSTEAAAAFYDSDGYAPLRDLRIDELTEWANVVIVPGLDLS